VKTQQYLLYKKIQFENFIEIGDSTLFWWFSTSDIINFVTTRQLQSLEYYCLLNWHHFYDPSNRHSTDCSNFMWTL